MLQASSNNEHLSASDPSESQVQLNELESELKKAISETPNSSVAHQRLASLYLTQNKAREAISEYQNAITLDSENPKLFIGIAIAYLHMKYYEMAEVMVKQAIEMDPEMDQAKKLKAYIDAKNAAIVETSTH